MYNSMAGLFAVAIILPIFWFILAIAFGVWMYRDAESRGMSGVPWLIVALVGGIIGLFVYMIVRKPKMAPPTAARLVALSTQDGPQVTVMEGKRRKRFCKYCGMEIEENVATCGRCGRRLTCRPGRWL